MLVRAGQERFDEQTLHIKGTGVSEVYRLDGQNVYLDGVKYRLTIKGHANSKRINGTANKVLVESVGNVLVNGVGNRCFYQNTLPNSDRETNRLLNLVGKRMD